MNTFPMDQIEKYIEENKDRFVEELFGLIRIPSVSSESAHKPDMYAAARYLKDLLQQAGADKAEIFETEGNPVTYAEKIIDPDKPTILVYGHMDVMPVEPLELWQSNPFEPEIREGKIWARGADDDKGQSMMQVKAFELMLKTNTLPCNVKFMIEGEEEIGSPNLGRWCEDHKDMLKADIILISDTTMINPDLPAITTGLRGLTYWEVEITGPNRDLHSGMYGGAVVNPIHVLLRMITQMVDDQGIITIPGFYDDVLDVSSEERGLLAEAPFDLEKYKAAIGVDQLNIEAGFNISERTAIRPSLDVCGIWGGYTGEGAKTVLPSKANAKISCRLVPDQDHEKIGALFTEYFKSIAPKSVKVRVDYLHGGQAYVCPIDLPAYQAAEQACIDVFGRRPVPFRSGGSIPIISTFEQILGIKSILMGFGLHSDAIHSPNENFPLEQFYKGIKTIPLFYRYFAERS